MVNLIGSLQHERMHGRENTSSAVATIHNNLKLQKKEAFKYKAEKFTTR